MCLEVNYSEEKFRGLIVQSDSFDWVSGGWLLDPLHRLASAAIRGAVGRLYANPGKAYP